MDQTKEFLVHLEGIVPQVKYRISTHRTITRIEIDFSLLVVEHSPVTGFNFYTSFQHGFGDGPNKVIKDAGDAAQAAATFLEKEGHYHKEVDPDTEAYSYVAGLRTV